MNLFSKGSLVYNFGWMLVGQCSGYGLKVVYFIAIARLLGVVQYGVVVGAFALVNIVAQFGGVGPVLIGFVKDTTGSFTLALISLAAFSFLAAAIAILMKAEAKPAATPALAE